TMHNAGRASWTPGAIQLGSQNPPNNNLWGLNRVALSGAVVTNANTTFNFNVTAPGTPGSYNLRWQMLQGTKWFGQATTNVVVSVAALMPTPTPTPTPSPSATPTPSPSATPSSKPTVFIAHLRAQSAGALASGTAILKLA